ncbi:cytochrome P450 2J2-like [Archocentrus centrarchus]|nr:cytochrome P450 2J2-like [Archocentrus centrarchus]
MNFTSWLLLGFVLVILADVIRNRRPHNFPPGPWAVPLLGNVFTGVDYKTMEELAQKYGPVFSLRRGSERVVFVTGYKMVKEALVSQLDNFVDRPIVPLFHVIFKGIGIALSNGYLWKKQRKFANTHLRYFGEGQKSLEKYIEVECHFLCEAFNEEQGRPFNPQYTITNAVGNIISSVVFGHRFEYSDPSFRKILELDNEAVVLAGSAQTQLYDAFPGIMKYLPGPHQTVHANYREIVAFLNREIEKHQEDWNPDDPRDFVDAYLSEMEKKKEDPHAGFNTETLLVCTLDLIEAGTESASTTLRWALAFVMNYPEIQGKLFSPAGLFNNAVSNIICQLVMGKRFDYSDHNFQLMLKYLSEILWLEGSIWGTLYESFPGLMKHLPGPHNKLFSHFDQVKDFITQELNRHKKDLDRNNPRDYIDAFLIKMENLKESDLGFTETNLVMCSADLFLAGTETTATTLMWALTFLIRHPDVQEKVQAEIDSVIGQTRQPSMADRPNLPYTDAVIHEIQRVGNIVPLNGFRIAAKDTTLDGYYIPKGTGVLPILTSVLFDKTEWETPDTFNPGHFLDANGKFVKREAFLPFSAGKRVCLGESLAKMELFLFFVGLLQQFTFSVPDGVELSTEGITGTTRVPEPFKVYAKAR